MTVTDVRPRLALPPAEQVRLLGRSTACRRGQILGELGAPRTVHRALAPSLRIAILAPRTDIGGGARILFEHANRLADRGHAVTVLSYMPAPAWFPLGPDFVEVPVGMRLVDRLPESDLVVCGYWEMVREVASAQVAPVVHFEQGDFHLFEDLEAPTHELVAANLRAADAHTAVSGAVQSILVGRYGVASDVIPNAVDPSVFHPGPSTPSDRRSVLCVGWDGNAFKGIDDVRRVATLLRATHPDVDLVWVTPKPPSADPGDIARVVVAPSQPELAQLYRSASAYLCASKYESFPLPPMEAMSCGAPVVTTANPGSLEYSRDGENALVVPIGDPTAMHEALCRLMNDEALAERLRTGGAATSAGYTWDAILDRLENVYRRVAEEFATPLDESAWDDVGLDATRADEDAQRRLSLVRRRTGAARLLVPVRRPAIEGHDVYQWQVIATRPGGVGDCRVFAPHRSAEPPTSLTYQRPFELICAGRFQEALNLLRAAWARGGSEETRGAMVRWIALCLLRLDRPQEAFSTLIEALPQAPDNPDYYYLAAMIGDRLGYEVDLEAVAELLRITGTGTRYEDFFACPCGNGSLDR